jgi:O-antigen/teichoic acid export membrane protein
MTVIGKYKKIPTSVKASLWYVFCNVLQKGIAFITIPIFTRLMTTEQYGKVTIYYSWLEIFTIFATLNLFYGVYNNALTKYPEDSETVTSSMLGLCTTITFSLFVIYCALHTWINKLTGMSTLMTCILFIEVLFVPAFRFWSSKQRYKYRYRTLIILSLLISVLTPLLGVPAVLISAEKGYAKILSGVFAELVVAVALYASIFHKGKVFYKKNYWKYALVFNLPLIPHYLSSTVLNQCDRIMIDNMCGTDKAGIYGLAYTIGSLAIIFNEAIMNSYTPYTYQKLKAGCFLDIKKNTKYLVIFIGVVAVALVTLAPEIIWILGGDKYSEGVWIIASISASIFFRFLYSLYSNIEFYYEENYFIMVASVICALLNIVTNYIFIKLYGYLAAGYTTLGCFAAYAFSHYMFSKYVFKKHTGQESLYDNRFIFFMAILVIALCLAMMALYDLPIVRYMVIVSVLVSVVLFRKKIIELIKMIREKV